MTGCLNSVVVADAGFRPEMRYAGTALAQAGLLRSYMTTVAFSPDGWLLGRERNSRVLQLAQTYARLRAIPEGVDPKSVEHIAAIPELARFSLNRTGKFPRHRRRMQDFLNRRFDQGVSLQIATSDRLLIGSYTSSVRAFRKAHERGIITFLNYPIAHHVWAKELLDEEAQLEPEYAATMQPPGASQSVVEQIDQEIELADYILGLSPFHVQTFIDSGVSPDKFVIAPLGVDLELFQPHSSGYQDDVFRVIFVGQITQRKGISYLLRAFQMADIPNSELLFVGNVVGPPDVWINQPRVRHIQHVPRSALPELYSTADVFVMPSLVEGFCMTAMEALACGLPTIVTPNTFGEEVVRNGMEGWNVPIRDASAIAERLVQLAEDALLRGQMSLAARIRAEEYSWDAYGGRITHAVRGLLTSCV